MGRCRLTGSGAGASLPPRRVRKASQGRYIGRDFKDELQSARQRVEAVALEGKVSGQREQQVQEAEARKGVVIGRNANSPQGGGEGRRLKRGEGESGDEDREAGPGTFCAIVRSLGCSHCNGKTAEFVWRGSELISFILEGSSRLQGEGWTAG